MGDKARGDAAIQGVWKRNKTCILDICVTGTDAKAYKDLSLRTVLEAETWAKKAKYLKVYLDKRHTFAPLAYSVNGMAGVESRAFEKRIASLLAENWNWEYIELVGFVRAKIVMPVIIAKTLLLRGAYLKLPK